jgi:hypothetical protein
MDLTFIRRWEKECYRWKERDIHRQLLFLNCITKIKKKKSEALDERQNVLLKKLAITINLKFYLMKKNVIFLLLLTAVTLNVFAKTPTGDKVDPFIEAKFKKEFGSSVDVSWKNVDGIAVATYVDQGTTKDVYYFDNGEILGLGKIVPKNMLPETIKATINDKVSSGIIQTVYEFRETGAPTRYFVTVVSKAYSLIVSANEFGQYEVREKIKNKLFGE